MILERSHTCTKAALRQLKHFELRILTSVTSEALAITSAFVTNSTTRTCSTAGGTFPVQINVLVGVCSAESLGYSEIVIRIFHSMRGNIDRIHRTNFLGVSQGINHYTVPNRKVGEIKKGVLLLIRTRAGWLCRCRCMGHHTVFSIVRPDVSAPFPIDTVHVVGGSDFSTRKTQMWCISGTAGDSLLPEQNFESLMCVKCICCRVIVGFQSVLANNTARMVRVNKLLCKVSGPLVISFNHLASLFTNIKYVASRDSFRV